MVTLVCPTCRKRLKVPDHLNGKQAHCPNCQTAVEVPAADLSVHDRTAKSDPVHGSPESVPNPFAHLCRDEGTTAPHRSTARKRSNPISNETWVGIGAMGVIAVVILFIVWIGLTQSAREAASITVDDLLFAAKSVDDFRLAANEAVLREETKEAFEKIDRHRNSPHVQEVFRQALRSRKVETRRAGISLLARLERSHQPHHRGEVINQFKPIVQQASADPDETVQKTAIDLLEQAAKQAEPTREEVAMKTQTELLVRWTSPLYALALGATYLLLGIGVGAWKSGWRWDFLQTEAWQFICILALFAGLFTIVWFVLIGCYRGLGIGAEGTFYLLLLFVFLPTLGTLGTFLSALPGWGISGRYRTVTYSCSSCGAGVNMWDIYRDGRRQHCRRCRVRLTGIKEDAKR